MASSCTGSLCLKVLLACSLIALAGCSDEPEQTSADRLEREATEFGDALEGYTAEQREEALRRAEEAVADLDERIDRLEEQLQERWSEMDQAARKRAESQLDALQDQRTRVSQWYDRLEESSAEAWVRMREGFEEAYAALREAWGEAAREWDSEP